MRFASVTDRLAALGSHKWAVHIEARRRAQAGEPVIMLSIGEPDSPAPQALIDTAVTSLQARRTGYSAGRGEAGVVEAIASLYACRSGRQVGPRNVAYLPGTQTALYVAMTVLVEAGDAVLVGDPMYATYEGVIRSTGATMMPVRLDPANGFHLRAADLERSVTPACRVLLMNSPHNPTGATLSHREIGEILEVCRAHDLWVISDEVYATMAYGARFASPVDHPLGWERAVAVSSISKSHMLPGFRAGWCMGPEAFIDRLLPVSETMLFGSPPFIEDAVAVALSREFQECGAMVESFDRRAHLMAGLLDGAPGLACATPEAGMFCMVDVSATGLDGEAFAWRLLEAGVAVMPGSSFGEGGRRHIRVALSADEAVLREAAGRIAGLAGRLVRDAA